MRNVLPLMVLKIPPKKYREKWAMCGLVVSGTARGRGGSFHSKRGSAPS